MSDLEALPTSAKGGYRTLLPKRLRTILRRMSETYPEEALGIERPEDVAPGGLVRGKNVRPYGPPLPDLVAYRPEAWRFLRMSRLYGVALGIVSASGNEADVTEFAQAVVRIEDWKGDLVAKWRSQADIDKFSSAFDRAVLSEHEEEIAHVALSGSKSD
jgi:hypothetical protein